MARRRVGAWLLVLVVAGGALAAAEQTGSSGSNSAGMEAFVAARLLESDHRYREALKAYESAMRAEPEVQEIRVRYAALLLEVGMSTRAVEVLGEASDLDWYGKRIRALALARSSTVDEKLLADADEALRSVLEERPDDLSVQLALAQVLQREGKIADAEALIAAIRETRGSSPQLLAYQAGLLRQLDRSQEAAELYAECAASSSSEGIGCRNNLVELLVQLGRSAEAGELMLKWLGDDDLDQLLHAGSLLYEGGRPEDALGVVRRVLQAAPDSKPAQTLEAYILSALGRYGEASARFRALLKTDRDNLDLLTAMAWATVRSGDLEGARGWLDRAWEIVQEDSGSPRAARVAVAGARVELAGGAVLRARSWLERAVPSPEVGEQLVVLLAETYRRQEAWSDGISALLRLQPQLEGRARTMARGNEAEFRLRLGDDGRAWKLLRPLLDAGDEQEVEIGLRVLQALERWQDLEREAAAAEGRFPDSRSVRFARATALERLGRTGESDAILRELVAQDPADAVAANYLGYSLADRGENLDEALQLISKAVAADPDNPAYLDSLGWVHFRLGNLDQAEYWLRHAVDGGGDDGTILAHLGEVLLQRGRTDEALELLRKAVARGCEHPEHVEKLIAGSRDAN